VSYASLVLDRDNAERDEELRVVGCETGGTFNPWARNRRSGAAGYFQVIARWHPWVNLRRLFEPFYNARVAYRISHGGRDWSAWECKP
jgi:hypothetical protein